MKPFNGATTHSVLLAMIVVCAILLASLWTTSNSSQSASPQSASPQSASSQSASSQSASSIGKSNLVAQQDSNQRTNGQSTFRRRGRATSNRDDYPTWKIDQHFEHDVFTFVRIQYDSLGYAMRGRQWDNDFPDCDWNFSVRLNELTSLEVDPNGKVMRLTDPQLFDYPFVFFSNINRMDLSEEEIIALRQYLDKGGFMMADDFWAPAAWQHVYREMKKVFPDREPRELHRDHDIFHLVYELEGTPQVPSIRAWQQGHLFEYWHGDPQGDEGPHFWGFFDDNERLVALLCHNNDIADGWEREGENAEYFRDYSERVSYPLGINIITYALTH